MQHDDHADDHQPDDHQPHHQQPHHDADHDLDALDELGLADDGSGTARLTVFVRGNVQGVGFRWWTRARALELGLRGSASNLPDGRVQVVAEGPRGGCIRLLELLAEQPSSAGRPGQVSGTTDQWAPPRGEPAGFSER